MKKYDHKKIESRWQKEWEKQPKLYKASERSEKKKMYVLDMFPYPSGDGLHVGHSENYTASDIYSRFMRMKNFEVLHPVGWDAFGLPAENYAIKTKIHPDISTHANIKNFKRQMKSLGISHDWDREIDTSSPEYYRWTQWMFLFLYKNGLAYKKKAYVNWCPSCQTVLANEQVVLGFCDRCKTEVIQKELEQWFFKITDFVEDSRTKTGNTKVSGLVSGLDKVDWPESTKSSQKNWIGRSVGASVNFEIISSNPMVEFTSDSELQVYTTRLDTIYGCTYCVIAPEHPYIEEFKKHIENYDDIQKYIVQTKKKSDLERTELSKEKTGIAIRGMKAINPFNGAELPVFVADYVLGNYGTGAVMGVPAHDERDFEFAKKYDLPIKRVISPSQAPSAVALPYLEHGSLVDSGKFTGLRSEEAKDKMTTWLQSERKGKKQINYRLRDWLISRQRYWGAPIPIIYCKNCAANDTKAKVEVNFYNLPNWKLIKSGEKTFETRALNPHERKRYFGNVKEGDSIKFTYVPKKESSIFTVKTVKTYKTLEEFFNDKIVLEKTFPGVVIDSLKELERIYSKFTPDYLDQINRNGLVAWEIEKFDQEKIVPVPDKQLPVILPKDVDFKPTGESPLKISKSFQKVLCPVCKAPARRESDTMDTFVCSSWYYLRFADPKNSKTFADRKKTDHWLPVNLYMGGAEHTVLHLLYARFITKALCKFGYVSFDEPFAKLKHQGMVLSSDGRKMSKSLGNVINPDDVIDLYGADTLRLYEMFMGPLEDPKPWNTSSIIGLRRFVERVWKISKLATEKSGDSEQVVVSLNKTIKKVGEDILELKFNTAISQMMIFVSDVEKSGAISKESMMNFMRILAPFAPHVTEEIWESLANKKSIHEEEWPAFDGDKIIESQMSIAIQVNGKLRADMTVSANMPEEEIRSLALSNDTVKKWMDGKEAKKVIYVRGKLVSIVV